MQDNGNNNNTNKMDECEMKENKKESQESSPHGMKTIKTNANTRFEVSNNESANSCMFYHKKPKKFNNHTFN